MAFSDFFKKKKGDSPAEELFQNAIQQYEKGEHQQAFQTLASAFMLDADYKQLYQFACTCLAALGANEEKDLFNDAVANFNKAEPFNKLGSHFSSGGDYMIAQPFFKRALSLDQSNTDTAHDLAIAYARRFNIKEAIKALESVNVHVDFWALWFFAKCKILNNEINDASVFITRLEKAFDGEENDDENEIPRLKVTELKEMLERHKTIAEPQQHIRDWQFIQYGGAILDYFDSEDQYVAGGRYVASWGSHESIREIIEKLKDFITALQVRIDAVKFLPDRNSEIVGKAISKVLNIRGSLLGADEQNDNCLVVAADSASLNEYEFNYISKGQVLFALNHSWLQSAMTSPDIIGFMTQNYYYPWDGNGFKMIDAEAGKFEKTPEDARSADEIAEDIANVKFESRDNSELFSFYKERKEHLKGIGNKTSNQRYNFMVESPVAGAYFGFS
jgi:tetratricopeptide (TPR) repeat protein